MCGSVRNKRIRVYAVILRARPWSLCSLVEHLAGTGMLWLVKQQQRLLPRLAQHLLLFPSFCGLLTGVRPFSTAALRGNPSPQNPPPSPPEPTHFMVEYLVDSCGLCRAEAVKASNRLVHLKSPDKPDAVLRLLKEEGLSDAHIRRLVVSFPKVLVADAKKTLEPKFRALQGAGFSKPEVAQMISANPVFICIRNAASKIEFWRKIVGDNEKLLKIFKNYFLVGSNTTGKINANLSFLRSVGE
uniref:ATP synthase epsilon chain, chloroplastic n=1 Tax=Anthurium amnicola TaxID=1678845 RepID=A0A1D1XE33_9ARAE